MGAVQRGVVRGSNKEGPGGDGRTNSFLPLGGSGSTVHPSNVGPGGDKRSGSFPLDGGAPACKPPNGSDFRFNVDQVQMPQPGSAIEPGKGAIPVNPFLPSGAVARVAAYTADEARGQVTQTAPHPDLQAALRSWLDRADGLVERRLADARQYAAAGKLPVANARLRELSVSLTRHISDARAHFYWSAFAQHRHAGLDPDVHQLNLAPTPEGESAARRTEIMGRRYAFDLIDLVSDAEAALTSAALAGGGQHLENWTAENGGRLSSRVRSELSTSQIAIYEAVGQILVKPELR